MNEHVQIEKQYKYIYCNFKLLSAISYNEIMDCADQRSDRNFCTVVA